MVSRFARGCRVHQRAPFRRRPLARLLAAVALLAPAAVPGTSVASDKEPAGEPFVHLFQTLNPRQWYVASYDHPNERFLTGWRKEKARLERDGRLVLELAPSRAEEGKPFEGGEVQRRGTFGYGRYEVVMTPARGDGVISSFFVYTGPYFGDTHEEIDIEFLGKETAGVYLNHFVDGEPLSGRFVELGEDAANASGLYAFEWSEDGIVWYAGAREIARVDASDVAIPRPPARIYVNIWAGGEAQRGWSGVAAPETTARAVYRCVSYRPPGSAAPQCSDAFPGREPL